MFFSAFQLLAPRALEAYSSVLPCYTLYIALYQSFLLLLYVEGKRFPRDPYVDKDLERRVQDNRSSSNHLETFSSQASVQGGNYLVVPINARFVNSRNKDLHTSTYISIEKLFELLEPGRINARIYVNCLD